MEPMEATQQKLAQPLLPLLRTKAFRNRQEQVNLAPVFFRWYLLTCPCFRLALRSVLDEARYGAQLSRQHQEVQQGRQGLAML